MSDEERRFTQAEVDRIVSERLARERRDTRVVSEPRVYAPESPHSWFLDVERLGRPGGDTAAQQRMTRYATELAVEMQRGSREGRRAERTIWHHTRHEDASKHEARFRERIGELRALTTGGGVTASAASGAAFVSPAFILDAWVPFRGAYRTFADQCASVPLPDYGMEVYVPAFTSAASATQQTEGSQVSETDPATGLQSGSLATVTGQVTVTQQFRDRAMGGGGVVDMMIGRQIGEQLEQQLDQYVLGQVLASAPQITDSGTIGSQFIGEFYTDVAQAREVLTDTAGVRLRPTHLFTTSDLYSYVTRQLDSSNRPIVVPTFAPGFPLPNGADPDNGTAPKWARFTGTVLPGGVLWFTDDNIPPSGSNTQILVSAPTDAVLLLEQPDPIMTVFPQTVAGNLEVIVNARKYVCVIVRHASGSARITGSLYPTTLV